MIINDFLFCLWMALLTQKFKHQILDKVVFLLKVFQETGTELILMWPSNSTVMLFHIVNLRTAEEYPFV